MSTTSSPEKLLKPLTTLLHTATLLKGLDLASIIISACSPTMSTSCLGISIGLGEGIRSPSSSKTENSSKTSELTDKSSTLGKFLGGQYLRLDLNLLVAHV